MIVPTIVFAFLFVSLVVMMINYNSIIKYYNRVDEAWADVDVQLKRRYDLIPNLVNMVQGYAEHEFELFMKVTNARADAVDAEIMSDPKDVTEKDNILSSTLKSLFAVSEAYPDLKANQNFIELQKELADTENKIQSARRFYNSTVLDFNNFIQMFPTNVFVLMYGYKKRPYFDLGSEKEARENVKVDFTKK
jgi:LemA protein